MVKHNVTGRVLKGEYKDWYVSIRPTNVDDEDKENPLGNTYVYIGTKRELRGGARNGVYNTLFPDYPSAIHSLELDGIIEGDEVHIEWFDEE